MHPHYIMRHMLILGWPKNYEGEMDIYHFCELIVYK